MKRFRFVLLTAAVLILGYFFGIFVSGVVAEPLGRPVQPEAVSIVNDQSSAFGELPVFEFTPQTAWMHNYNINSDIVTTSTTTGTVAFANNMARLVTGAEASTTATMQTKLPLRYLPGQGGTTRFTVVFTTCKAGSRQLIGLGDSDDGLFFGCNGETFGVLRRVGGVDNWTAKASWSERTRTGVDNLIDITTGNVYQIKFQWLGYGAISFYIENSDGVLELVHRIRYVNQSTTPSLFNPQLPIMAQVENVTNTTLITLFAQSAVAGVDGKTLTAGNNDHPLTLHRTQAVTKASISTEVALITISNTLIYQGKTNRVRVVPEMLSIAVDGTKNVTFRCLLSTTLGGTPSFTAWNSNTSVTSFDVAGTTVSGGTEVCNLRLDKTGAMIFDLEQLGVSLAGDDTLTITAQSTNATNVDLSILWMENF